MSVSLRLRRDGRRKRPVYALVAADSRAPRDGRFIEFLGRYEPLSEPARVAFEAERVVYWLSQGAQPSHTVRNLLQKEGILLRAAMTRRGEEPEAIEAAVAEFLERRAAKASATPTRADRRREALEAERKKAAERAAEIAKEKAEMEAELERQRQIHEEAERAEREAQLAASTEAAADAAALAEAADQPKTTAAEEASAAQEEEAPATEEAAPEADTSGEAVAETQQAEEAADEAGADDATADATAETVAEEAPDAAEAQPAAEETTAAEVADEAGAEVADQAEAGAAEVPAPTAQADDLTTIYGVGPTYAEILVNAGLTTFAAVGEASVEQIQAAITEAGSTTAGNEETWPEQARLLASGDQAAFDAYVETIKS